MFKVQLLTQPAVDLRRFTGLLKDVNSIDAKAIPPRDKLRLALDDLIDRDDEGQKHLFYSFYLELPFPAMIEMSNFPLWSYMRTSYLVQSITVKAIITAPLDLWREFNKWAQESDPVSSVAKEIARCLS